MLDHETKVESVAEANSEQAVTNETLEKVTANSTANDTNNSTEAPIEATPKKEVQPGNLVPLSKMIEAGVHLGLKPNKWNPKMRSFIYAKKFNHIIDIKKTVHFLEKAYQYLLDIVKAGGELIFVGTKNKLVSALIKECASRVGVYYVSDRWMGGTFTNFKVLSNSINKLNNLELLLSDDEQKAGRTKKELVQLSKKYEKLLKFYGGVKNMKALPQVLVCFDPVEDINAVLEARALKIPVVAVANTNADPDLIDFIIPANNFSVRSAYLLVNALADAVAVANDQPTVVVGKSADEITLPEIQRRKRPNNPYQRNPRGHYQVAAVNQPNASETPAPTTTSETPDNN